MMHLRAKITFDPDPGKYARRFGEVTRAAHYEGAVFWHHEILPLHFRTGAAGRYGYDPRSPKYMYGLRKIGKPELVYKGTAQEMATRGKPGIKAYPSRVRIELYTPRYIFQNPPANQPAMAEEIFFVAADEQRRIEVVEQREAERRLKRMGETRTVTIG